MRQQQVVEAGVGGGQPVRVGAGAGDDEGRVQVRQALRVCVCGGREVGREEGRGGQ